MRYCPDCQNSVLQKNVKKIKLLNHSIGVSHLLSFESTWLPAWRSALQALALPLCDAKWSGVRSLFSEIEHENQFQRKNQCYVPCWYINIPMVSLVHHIRIENHVVHYQAEVSMFCSFKNVFLINQACCCCLLLQFVNGTIHMFSHTFVFNNHKQAWHNAYVTFKLSKERVWMMMENFVKNRIWKVQDDNDMFCDKEVSFVECNLFAM